MSTGNFEKKRFNHSSRGAAGMKKISRFAVMLFAAALIVLSAMPAFAATTTSKKSSAAGFSIPAAMTIQVGEKKTLSVTQPTGKYANVSFQYTPTYVSASGFSAGSYWGKKAEITYTGKAPGTFTSIVTVRVFNKAEVSSSLSAQYTLYCKVTVVNKGTSTIQTTSPKRIALQSIYLNKSSATIYPGDTVQLSVSYSPANTTDSKSVSWSSSNSAVASVSGGKVTAKKAGSATITAKVGSKSASCKVTVKTSPNVEIGAGTGSQNADGYYKNVTDAYSILNTFRTTKANQWYWNPANTAKVTTYGLKALNRDTQLENVAKLRAKEQWTMYYERGKATHDRPNGTSCFTAYPSNLQSKGENLAWGQTTSSSVITDPTWGWAETNCNYSGQGHRRNMLSANFTKVGIACYIKDGKTCWAMCLGK